MEKLEVKHLAPYLPHGILTNKGKLVSIHTDCQSAKEPILKLESELDKTDITEQIIKYPDFEPSKYGYETCLISEVKPILRPLSDLVSDGDLSPIGETVFRNFPEMFETMPLIVDKNPSMLYYEYGIVESLFEFHFDVFGLIDKGLAIKYHENSEI